MNFSGKQSGETIYSRQEKFVDVWECFKNWYFFLIFWIENWNINKILTLALWSTQFVLIVLNMGKRLFLILLFFMENEEKCWMSLLLLLYVCMYVISKQCQIQLKQRFNKELSVLSSRAHGFVQMVFFKFSGYSSFQYFISSL